MTALTQLLLQAFPAAYQAEAGQLLAHMQHPRSPSPTLEPDKLLLGGQTIRLIRRQYGLAIARRPESLNPIQRAMFHCLHTRHHDGHVREQHFAALLAPDQPAFVAPFAAQLLGEYVLPIQEQVRTFSRHNRAILATFWPKTLPTGANSKTASAAIGTATTATNTPTGQATPLTGWRKKSMPK